MAGVGDTNVIDLVTHNAQSNEFALIICETRQWGSTPNQLTELLAKVNAYANYILDGGMERDYSRPPGSSVRIQIDCVCAPHQIPIEVEASLGPQLSEMGIKLFINPLYE